MKFWEVLLLLVMTGVLIFGLYALWVNLPKETQEFESFSPSIEEGINLPAKSNQFYPNMRFQDKRISYSIESACSQGKRSDIVKALNILDEKTILEFYPKVDGEINFVCSEIAPDPEERNHFIAGEGGPTEIVNTSVYSVIFSAKVSLYRPEKCDTPQIALHEVFHALGFDHNNDKKSIMYPVTDCNQVIDSYLIESINSLYSVNSLPDLAIEKVNASRSGRYLNFDITIANHGLADSMKSRLIIEADSEEVRTFDLGEIDIGTRKLLNVENVRAPTSFDSLVFRVESDGQEINNNNNRAVLNQE